MIDELEGYQEGWQGGTAPTAVAPSEDPLAGYTPDWRKQTQTQLADPLADYTPEWNKAGIKDQIIEGLKEQGRGLVQAFKYFAEGLGTANMLGIKDPVTGQLPPDQTSRGKDLAAAAAGDPEAALRVKRATMGSALILSTVAATRVAAGLKAGSGIMAGADAGRAVKALRFVTAEAVGGGVYGYIDPGDRNRAAAVAEDAILFPIAGGILHGAFKTTGWIGKSLTQKAKDVLAKATKPEAEAIAKRAATNYENLKPVEEAALTQPEIVAAQSAAVEAAVNKVDIPPRITPEGPVVPFPKITPEHRKVLKEIFKGDAKIYEATYKAMQNADDAVKYARQKALMTAMEAKLTPAQRAQLRTLDNAGWEDELARAIEAGDDLAAADIAITQAVEEVPIAAVATPEVKAEALGIAKAVAQDPRIVAAKEETRTLAEGLTANITSLVEQARMPKESTRQLRVIRAVPERNSIVLEYPNGKRDEFDLDQIGVAARQSDLDLAAAYEPLYIEGQRLMSEAKIAKGQQQLRTAVDIAKQLEQEVKESVTNAVKNDDMETLALKVFADMSRRRDQAITGLRESWKPEFKAMREAEAVELSDLLPAQPVVEAAAPEVTKNGAVLFARASEKVKKMIEDEGASIATRNAARLGLGAASIGTGSLVDEEHSGFTNTSIKAVAGFLGLAAAVPGPRTAAWLRTSNLTKNIVKWADFGRYATTFGKEGADLWHSITSESRAGAVLKSNELHKLLAKNPKAQILKTDEVLNHNFGFAADEGQLAPEFHLLTPEQQKEALSLRAMNDNVGNWLKANGYISDVKENYFKHILPDETFEKWNAQRKLFREQGNVQAAAQMETLRGAQAYAKLNNLPEPIKNVADAQAKHMIDVGRMVASEEAEKFFVARGLLLDNQPLTRPQDWRVVKGTNKMAPDDVATALERIKSPSFSIAFVDPTRAVMMKAIMIFPWEHGINLIRAQAAFDPTMRGYRKALQQITDADPVVLEVSKYAQLFRQPDMLNEANDIFSRVLDKVGLGNLKPVQHAADRWLWERWAPAVGISAWTMEMRKWGQRTGHKFLKGSPEYEAAARKAGEFANDAMGKIPDLIQDPKLAASMRLLLFSPAWLRTRMSILGHAAGDLQALASGEMKWNEASYLKYKMKSVALGVMFTYGLSKIWSKEDPQFNPNTTKLYARTGLYDDRGRELGVDLVGWWQDDLKLFNDPWTFLEHRMNPLLRSTYQQIHGTDAFGNELSGMERYENLFRQLGPLSSIPETIHNAATGELDARQAVKQGSEFLAIGNVSSLPRVQDVVLAKYAEKIIRDVGLPVRREDVYEITKLMKQNHRMSGNLYGKNINTWLAYKLRSYPSQHPISSLWYKGKQIIKDTFRD